MNTFMTVLTTGALVPLTLAHPLVVAAHVIHERQEQQQERMRQGAKSGDTFMLKEKADVMSDQDTASMHIYKDTRD